MVFASGARPRLTAYDDLLLPGKTRRSARHQLGMTTFQAQAPRECGGYGPPVDVTAWRRCRLLEAGFPPELARRLASTRRVDLHALLQLVDRGCPPALAARILAPFDDEPGR